MSPLESKVLFVIVGASLLAVVYQISIWVYNITYHPLANVPGPKLWAASRIPFELSIIRGRCNREVCALHERYGDIVRTGPKSVSYIHPDAWGEIMDRRGSYGRNELHRDRLRLSDSFRVNGAAEILTADDVTHSRQRKVLAHAFSDRALREEHQPLVQNNVDLMIYKLRSLTRGKTTGGTVDLANWLNLATFDIIGDLTFGEVFGCLEQGEYHPWVKLMAESVHIVTIMSAATQFPWFDWFLKTLTSRWVLKAIRQHHELTLDKVGRRLAKDKPRGDFLTQIMKYNGTEKELSRDELMSNSTLMIPAGSETSSAGIASCVYNILAKPEATHILLEEINSKFKSEDEITFETVAEMKYLDACINEAFRLYPPIAIFNPRVVGVQEGCDVMGAHVPYKGTVGIHHWAAYHCTRNFKNPFDFEPTRWLGDLRFQSDRRDILKPFSIGPKNCIGKGLAWAEIRIMVVRLFYNFNMELCSESYDWTNQRAYWTWERRPMWVKLTEKDVPHRIYQSDKWSEQL